MWKLIPIWMDNLICRIFEAVGFNPVIVLCKHTEQDVRIASVCFSEKSAQWVIDHNQDEHRKYWMTVPRLTI